MLFAASHDITIHLISITPIHMDMTSHALIAKLQDWVRELEP